MHLHTVMGGDGVPLHVVDTATPTDRSILFIHGFSQSWLTWSRQLRSPLANEFRLVALDLRGHGRSGKPRDAYGDSQLWADDIHAVITALNLSAPILCGSSYGPLVMLDYVRHYGEQNIGGLQFVGGVTNLGSAKALSVLSPAFLNLIPGFFSENTEDSVRSLESLFRMCIAEEPSMEDACLALGWALLTPPHVRRSLFSRMLDNDELLRTLRKPVLLTHGSLDAVVTPQIVHQHQSLIPHAQIHLMNGAGHAAFWDHTEAFNERLRAFAYGDEPRISM
jgi:pimeloyl-ACP methyl ester carboxylesterase